MPEALDLGARSPAYLCGRLLAEHENLQEAVYRVAGESTVNQTVGDGYFAIASVRPSTAFPRIETLAKVHFTKLRTLRKPGAQAVHQVIEQSVVQLHQGIGGKFPDFLDLEDQARFALGYYHQRAENRRQRTAAKQQQTEFGETSAE